MFIGPISGNGQVRKWGFRGHLVVAGLAGLTALSISSSAVAQMPATDFNQLAARCAPQIHPVTLSALVMQESQANPLAIGINGKSAKLARQPKTLDEAIATAEWLKKNGHNFDAGLGQINVKNMGWLGLNVADLFDPCINLRAAATVLQDCYSRAATGAGAGQGALRSALSCYNTGNFKRGFANGYVAKVSSRVGVQIPQVRHPGSRSVAAMAPVRGDTESGAVEVAFEPAPRAGKADVFGGQSGDAFSAPTTPEFVENSVTLSDRVTRRVVTQ